MSDTLTPPSTRTRLRLAHIDIATLAARLDGDDLTEPLPLPDWAYDTVRASIHYRTGRLAALAALILEHPELEPTLDALLVNEITHAREEERFLEHLSWMHANRPASEVRHWRGLDFYGLRCTFPGCEG